MKRNAKKTVVVIALIALMAIPSMMAYFTDVENDQNVFTTGNIEIQLTDSIDNDVDNVVPNQNLGNATVKNTGKNPAHVFVKVTESHENLDKALVYTPAGDDEVVDGYYYLGELAVGSDAVNIFTSDVMVDDELVNTDLTVDPAAEGNVDANEEKDYKLDYEVYAVQSETFTGAAEAWAATFGAN